MKLVGGTLLLIGAAAIAQDDQSQPVDFPTLPKLVRKPSEFVPSGWKLVAIKRGDLNGDGRPDVVVLMRMTDPANIKPVQSNPYYKQDDTNPYLLAIGFAGPGGYKLAASNHELFPREIAPMHGDDSPGAKTFTVSRRGLSLTFGHSRGSDRYRFRWNGRDFALVGYDCAGVAGNTIYQLSANYLTGRARFEQSGIGDDRSHVRTVRIRTGNRPTLNEANWNLGWAGQDTDGSDLSC
jgi:hypothetical protein